jgi:hypothetical protein
MWLGCVVAYALYLVSCLLWAEYSSGTEYRVGNLFTVRMHDPLGMRGVDGEVDDAELFFLILAMMFCAVALWLQLAWVDTDPGVVDTREADLEEVTDRFILQWRWWRLFDLTF